MISRRRLLTYRGIALLLSLTLGMAACELFFSLRQRREAAQFTKAGHGGDWIGDPRWGWKPSQGEFRRTTPEFVQTGSINQLFMNDIPYDAEADRTRTRVLALGDSHTFAVGVSMPESWPRRLEARLNERGSGNNQFRVYNAGVPGYSLHQYLLRLIDQGPQLKPKYVVVGLSYATDFYDLLPPDRGGWIYGAEFPRDYFDFDSSGKLVLKHGAATNDEQGMEHAHPAQSLRRRLAGFATFQALRRTRAALFIGSHVNIGGQSVWPNMEVVVRRTPLPSQEYQWQLALALLERLDQESRRMGAQLVIVGIPYLPQVYDEIWNSTFGGRKEFDRGAATDRVASFCREHGIAYVETVDEFRRRVAQEGHWLHYRVDAHPTPEGQDLIAEMLANSELFTRAP